MLLFFGSRESVRPHSLMGDRGYITSVKNEAVQMLGKYARATCLFRQTLSAYGKESWVKKKRVETKMRF